MCEHCSLVSYSIYTITFLTTHLEVVVSSILFRTLDHLRCARIISSSFREDNKPCLKEYRSSINKMWSMSLSWHESQLYNLSFTISISFSSYSWDHYYHYHSSWNTSQWFIFIYYLRLNQHMYKCYKLHIKTLLALLNQHYVRQCYQWYSKTYLIQS